MRKNVLLGMVFVFVLLTYQLNNLPTAFAKGAGSSAGTTLTQPVSAKAAAMAEACSSLSGEVLCLHYNPAGLSTLKKQEVLFMYQSGLGKDSLATLIYGRRFPFATLGGSILYYDTGKIELVDLAGEAINKTGQRDIIFTVGAAMPTYGGKIPVGLNLKIISSQIFGESASAFAIDFGGQYKGLVEGVDIGLSFQNLGTKLKYISEGESLPFTIRLGGSYRKNFTEHTLTGSLDLPYYLNEKEILALLGAEYRYKSLLSFRAGYRLNMSNSSGEAESFNLGLGITWENYSLDYAIGITKNLSLPHRISIQAKF
ncbi:hypothetical protein ES705_24476 [subsurface metagenome]|nr:PorV/PorQ family protein [Clostridia bacterium]